MIRRESAIKSKNWKKTDEHLLEEWSDHSKGYRWMHEQARLKFARTNAQFQIPVIIISTITGAANFAQDRVPSDFQGYYSLIVGFMNIVAGVIATIQTFLKVSELLEGHRVASMSWGKYYHNVKTELQKEPDDRENVNDFMKYAKLEYEKLVEQSPPIPPNIILSFKERVDKGGYKVYLPPVMGVFDKFEIAENNLSNMVFVQKDKSDVEKVLNDIENQEEMSMLPDKKKTQFRLDDGNGLLSSRLMSSLLNNNLSPSVSEAQYIDNTEENIEEIVNDVVVNNDNDESQ